MKSYVAGIGFLIVAATSGLLSGCGATSDDHQDVPATHEGDTTESTPKAQQTVRTPSGEAGAAAGVAEWEVGGGVLRAFDTAGQLKADFVIDGNAGVVRSSFPQVGERSLREGELSTGWSSETETYYRAFGDDARTAAENYTSATVMNKALYACYTYFYDCEVAGSYGIMQGWWTYYECRYPAVTSCPDSRWPVALWYQ